VSVPLAIAGDLDRARFVRTVAELERGRDAGLHLGGQLLLARGGEVVADAGFGAARPGEPMTRDRRMFWLSSTKPVAAVAIALLWERGRLGLDDRVAHHLPEFAAGGKGAVTIRHLLTHTAGIRMFDSRWLALGRDGIFARVAAQKLEPGWEPGRKAGYHLASSWFVLGELVRRLDGRPFEDFVHQEIFAPLGMSSCSLALPPEALDAVRPRIAPMHEVGGSGPRELADWSSDTRLTVCSPGASGLGPIGELARLYGCLLAGGAPLLRPQTVEAIAARHRVGLVDQTFRAKLDWGLGVIVDSKHYGEGRIPYGYGPHAGPRTFGHSGARSSTAFADPDAGLVVALAVNGLPDDDTHRERFHRLTGAIYEDLGLAGS
jgi:CubicO group peptidase (beta-lactamase class C family)